MIPRIPLCAVLATWLARPTMPDVAPRDILVLLVMLCKAMCPPLDGDPLARDVKGSVLSTAFLTRPETSFSTFVIGVTSVFYYENFAVVYGT